MAQLVYLDNSVIRALIDSPKTWNNFYDDFVKIFGEHTRPVYSYYLFLEYIGFIKSELKRPTEEMLKFDNIGKNYNRAVKETDKIGLALDEYFIKAYDDLYNQLSSLE